MIEANDLSVRGRESVISENIENLSKLNNYQCNPSAVFLQVATYALLCVGAIFVSYGILKGKVIKNISPIFKISLTVTIWTVIIGIFFFNILLKICSFRNMKGEKNLLEEKLKEEFENFRKDKREEFERQEERISELSKHIEGLERQKEGLIRKNQNLFNRYEKVREDLRKNMKLLQFFQRQSGKEKRNLKREIKDQKNSYNRALRERTSECISFRKEKVELFEKIALIEGEKALLENENLELKNRLKEQRSEMRSSMERIRRSENLIQNILPALNMARGEREDVTIEDFTTMESAEKVIEEIKANLNCEESDRRKKMFGVISNSRVRDLQKKVFKLEEEIETLSERIRELEEKNRELEEELEEIEG